MTRQHYDVEAKPIPTRIQNALWALEFGTYEEKHEPYFHIFTSLLPLSLGAHGNTPASLLCAPALPEGALELHQRLMRELLEATALRGDVEKHHSELAAMAKALGDAHARAASTAHAAALELEQHESAPALVAAALAENAAFRKAEDTARELVALFGFDPRCVHERAFQINDYADDNRCTKHDDVLAHHARRLSRAIHAAHEAAKAPEAVAVRLTVR